MKKVLIGISIVTLLTACSEIRGKKEVKPAPQKVIKGKKAGLSEFEVVEVNIPHQYQIAIAWPDDVKNVVIEDDGKKVFTTSSSKEFLYTIRDSTPYNIRVFNYDGERPILLGEFVGETPIDYSFSQLVDLKQNMELSAHRVFFINQTSIQTNGYELKIKTDQVYSENAEIFSFQKDSKAGLDKNGRNGGLVQITALTGVGHLRISMRGENGGDGVSGLPHSGRAPNGGEGRPGRHRCINGPLGRPVRCICTSAPGQGGNGATGAKGNSGSQGGRGGDSGVIIVEVRDRSELVVEPVQEPGTAGTPGTGSEGQEGGYGGPGGNTPSSACNAAGRGGNGSKGPHGDDGVRQSNGESQKLCISIGQGEAKCKLL